MRFRRRVRKRGPLNETKVIKLIEKLNNNQEGYAIQKNFYLNFFLYAFVQICLKYRKKATSTTSI